MFLPQQTKALGDSSSTQLRSVGRQQTAQTLTQLYIEELQEVEVSSKKRTLKKVNIKEERT